MDLIISLDSEDFVTPEAADAERWWADELSRRDLRGCFQCVAEMLRSLILWNRQDVIEALCRHETDYHSNYHSLPPTHPQALEGRTLAEGIEWVLRREAGGLTTHLENFGRMPVSYCPPGGCWTAATLVAMAALGMRVLSGSPIREAATPFWYCGMLVSRYDLRIEKYFEHGQCGIEAFKAAFDKRASEIGEHGLMVLGTHPTRMLTTAFWDKQFFGARDLAPGERLPAPLYSPDRIQMNKDCARRCLDWVQKRADVQFTDYAGLYMKHSVERRDLTVLLAESKLRPGEEGCLPLKYDPRGSYLPARVFEEMRWNWGPLPVGFSGRELVKQACGLAWTSGPAIRG